MSIYANGNVTLGDLLKHLAALPADQSPCRLSRTMQRNSTTARQWKCACRKS
jgi:hypothetical protein